MDASCPRHPPPTPPADTLGDSEASAKAGGKEVCCCCVELRDLRGTLAVLVRFILDSGDLRRRALVER